jgi:hypothetical protein
VSARGHEVVRGYIDDLEGAAEQAHEPDET